MKSSKHFKKNKKKRGIKPRFFIACRRHDPGRAFVL